MGEVLPWGETHAELAASVLADPSAPPRLALAAFLFQRGAESELRAMTERALDLYCDELDLAAPT